MSVASELRDARARAGFSLEEASRRTRIPQRYLEALEKGDHSVFPPGPFLSGYTRQYRGFLGLPDAPASAEPPPEPTVTVTTSSIGRPGGPLRLVGLGALALVAVGLTAALVLDRPSAEPAPVGSAPDQVVLVSVAEPVRATVVADDREVFHGALSNGQQYRFAAHDKLELDLGTLEGVILHFNGRKLMPLGQLDPARRLIFIDDRGE